MWYSISTVESEALFKLRRDLATIAERLGRLCVVIEKHYGAEHAAEEGKGQEEPARQPIQAVISYDEKTVRNKEAEQNKQHAVQNSIKWAAWCAFWAATAYAAISLFVYCQIRRSTAAAIAQVSVMREQFENADRPWISVSAVMLHGIRFATGTPPQLFFKLTFRNIGKSTATDLFPRVTSITLPPVGADWGIPMENQETLCSSQERLATGFQREIIFPGQEWSVNVDTGLAPARAMPPKLRSALPPEITRQIRPVIIGCVDYRYATSTKLHQTGFIYVLYVGPNKKWPPLEEGVGTPLERLVLRPFELGGRYAN